MPPKESSRAVGADAQTIRCTACGANIPLTDALLHSVREKLQTDMARELKERQDALDLENEKKLRELERRERDLHVREGGFEDRLKKELEARGRALEDEARKRVEAENARALESKEADITGLQDKLARAFETEEQLRREKRELEEAKAAMGVEIQRAIDVEKAKMTEAQALKDKERDLLIDGLKKRADELQQKLDQGSQQSQGEAQELVLEDALRGEFVNDEIEPIRKGAEGADILQIVKVGDREVGRILWESKRTKRWSDDWLDKLRKDQAEKAADIGIIVSRALPPKVLTFAIDGGVVISDVSHALPLGTLLRLKVIDLARAKVANEGRFEKKEMLYDYVTGTAFRSTIQAAMEANKSALEDLDLEQDYMTSKWRKRRVQIRTNTIAILQAFGDMQGIVGGKVLPEFQEIKELSEAERWPLGLPEGSSNGGSVGASEGHLPPTRKASGRRRVSGPEE